KNVEAELSQGKYHFTALRAAIIIGSGSASFEIIRDLVEKLPVMIKPKWLNTKCQPIAVADVISFLSQTLFNSETYDKNYDIGGPDILTYKQMLLDFAAVRKLNRKIFIVPVMTPRLSSYWLYFVTSTSYKLAVALVDSMKIEVICRNNDLAKILNIEPLSYRQSLEKAFSKIENNAIISSWKDAYASSGIDITISDYITVPSHGCFIDKRTQPSNNHEGCIDKIWSIGGKKGWYYGNWLWKLRGFMDKMVGGVGLRRGRTNNNSLHAGDALDFWRVLYANKQEGRLILFAEMRLPGEAWLEFNLKDNLLVQTATFRPRGLAGRLYWYSVYPFHGLIFNGLIKKLV
ncbi:MAG: SDR family oxidoreductase, partial [Cyclobacteriaceae bacterium]